MKILPNGIAVIEGDKWISAWVELEGRLDHDQNMLPVVLPYIKEGDTVVDVGAFIGDHTIAYLNKVGAGGRVYAFEPNPEAFECLVHNCPKADCINMGLSDRPGTLSFFYNDNAGASFIHETARGLDVPVITLDNSLIDRVDFLKIDVEGMELRVIHGGLKTITRCKPIILMEINPGALERWRTTPFELVSYVESLGYQHKGVYGNEKLTDPQSDLLFIPI